jgi:hypothetical protein
MGLHESYQKFVIDNSVKIAAVESALRSLTYIIPGISLVYK